MPINAKIEQGKFYHYFQPVYNLSNWKIEGYETLLRSHVSSSPRQAFQTAEQEGFLYELDISSIYNGVYYYNKTNFHKPYGRLYINVFLNTILNPAFPAFLTFLKNSFPSRGNIIFEINQPGITADLACIKEASRAIRESGFETALVDVGTSHFGIREVMEIEPNYIKLNKYFISGLDQSKKKQDAIKLINQYCNKWGIKLIIEGIETPAELATVRILGIVYAQGYVLAMPQSLERAHDWQRLPQLKRDALCSFYRLETDSLPF